MATTIEKQLGRTALVETLGDPREFVAKYNEAARIHNIKHGQKLPLFGAETLEGLGIKPPLVDRRIVLGLQRRDEELRKGATGQATDEIAFNWIQISSELRWQESLKLCECPVGCFAISFWQVITDSSLCI
jgi:hypothetical protein